MLRKWKNAIVGFSKHRKLVPTRRRHKLQITFTTQRQRQRHFLVRMHRKFGMPLTTAIGTAAAFDFRV